MARIVSGGNELLQPRTILKDHVHIQPGNIVADFGCGGSGFFTLESARLAGEKGQVYAVDIVKGVLTSVDSKARLQGLYNIKTVWSDLEIYGAADIPERSVDVGMLVNILFQSHQHEDIIKEVTRLIKPGGTLLIIDWNDTPVPFGPAEGDRVSIQSLRATVPPLGYEEETVFEAGQYHFGLVFRKVS